MTHKPSLKQAFTLIELIVAITILAVILLSVFMIYSNILNINKRLELSRMIHENTRRITETLAQDVREKGIDFEYYDGSNNFKTLDYNGSGALVLAINGGRKYYLMKESTVSGEISYCTEAERKAPATKCFLGLDNGAIKARISDHSVAIDDLHLFISGKGSKGITNLWQEGKVLMVFNIRVADQKGLTSDMARLTTLRVQTTISEKIYKSY